MNSFGAKLKSCRKDMSLSQKELGQKVGVAESTISLYESNKRFPDAETLQKISSLFNVSLDYLLGNAPCKKPVSPIGRGVRIPVLGRVVAGIPIEAVEEILDYEEITLNLPQRVNFCTASQGKFNGAYPTRWRRRHRQEAANRRFW